jgi:transposase
VVYRKEAAMGSVAVVAMDIHKKFSKAVMMDWDCGVIGERMIYHDGRGEMKEFFGGLDRDTDVVMEATFNWPWIADMAEEAGLRAHLVDPVRAREMARGYSKSDRKDAIYLGRLFLSSALFPQVYLAPVEVRDRRWLFRLRLLLVRMRTAVKNAVHGQLFRLGYAPEVDIFGDSGRRLLGALELSQTERMLLNEKLEAIDDLAGHIEYLEGHIERQLREDSRAGILMSLPGVGKITAYAMLAEIGDIRRFPDRRALSAYAGLLPLQDESGGKEKAKHTGARCNRHLRWTAIEAVTGAVRSSGRMRSLHTRVCRRNRGMAGKARVAVAREIVELAWILLTRNQRYDEQRPARPGSEKAEESCDPNRASQTPLCARS